MYKYGEKNLALIHVMIQSPYVTKIKRDVAMTFTTYIANSGGLLGLCLGFSFMSGIEIMFCFCWFCREFKKKAFSEHEQCLSVDANKCENQKEEEMQIFNEILLVNEMKNISESVNHMMEELDELKKVVKNSE